MSDNLLLGIITAIFGLLTTGFTAFMGYQTLKLNIKATAAAIAVTAVKEKAEEAATMVKEVKRNLKTTTAKSAKKLDQIHTLVNSNMGIQLKLSASALRRVADLTKKAGDKEAAEMAEAALKEHEAQQAMVDNG